MRAQRGSPQITFSRHPQTSIHKTLYIWLVDRQTKLRAVAIYTEFNRFGFHEPCKLANVVCYVLSCFARVVLCVVLCCCASRVACCAVCCRVLWRLVSPAILLRCLVIFCAFMLSYVFCYASCCVPFCLSYFRLLHWLHQFGFYEPCKLANAVCYVLSCVVRVVLVCVVLCSRASRVACFA